MQRTEIARVQTTEADRLVNYIVTLEYTPAETDPDDGYEIDPEWTATLYRRFEQDGDRFDDSHDTIGIFLCDVEDRAPTVNDITDDVWDDLFSDARQKSGWLSWHACVTSSRLIVRLLQEAGVP